MLRFRVFLLRSARGTILLLRGPQNLGTSQEIHLCVIVLSLILDYRLGLWKRLTSQLLVLFFINTVSIYTCAATHITTSGFTQVGGFFLLCCTYVCTLNHKYVYTSVVVFFLARAHNLSACYFVCLRFAFSVQEQCFRLYLY